MKLHNKSEFCEEIFSLGFTDHFSPLFVLISFHRKNLIDIQKIETNLSLVIISQTYLKHRLNRVCAIYKANYCQQQKRIGEQSKLIHFLTYSDYT